ncbi:MAG: sodium/solute symporter [Candidatus Methanomethyliaceae archaeon]
MDPTTIIIVCIILYFAVTIVIGIYFKKRAEKDISEFYVAGRSIPGMIMALGYYSTFLSTATFIGQAGYSYRAGLPWVFVGLIWVGFCIFAWYVLAPRLRAQTEVLGSITATDYFHYRYDSKLLRVFGAIIAIFAQIFYLTSILIGCAWLFTYALKVPYEIGAIILVVATLIYLVTSGAWSVYYTDALQGAIMLVAAILLFSLVIIMGGGISNCLAVLQNCPDPIPGGKVIGDKLLTWSLVSPLYVIAIGFSIGAKQISDPKITTRVYAIKDKKALKIARLWTPIFLLITSLVVFPLGAFAHAIIPQDKALFFFTKTDQVVPYVLSLIENPFIVGFIIAGWFAAAMSSISPSVLVAATQLTRDILQVISKRAQQWSEKRVINITRLFIVIYSIIFLIIAISPPYGIVELTAYTGSVFASAFAPPILGGLLWRRATKAGALASMIVGLVVTGVWRFWIISAYPWIYQVYWIHEVIVGFITALIAYIIVCLLTKPPPEEIVNKAMTAKLTD